ncbi:MAG: hypothetical protein CM1200mP40_01940 [Gammaproteobacteria bacterium]|nr:MAG: hypothetical protein CM1200mP40_01940 [Gammaproteobacteria bacterium]
MILFINGLQWTGYKKLEWGCVGESSCADSGAGPIYWGAQSIDSLFRRTSIWRCNGGRILMAIPPTYLPKVIEGLKNSQQRLRYPIAQYGFNNDVRAGMGLVIALK